MPNSASSSPKDKRPIIVVTGANAGVGLGICQRLIVQLSSPTPSDTLPTNPRTDTPASDPRPPTPFAAPNGATLILACRNPIKAHKARQQLLRLLKWIENLPEHVDTPTGPPETWAYGFDHESKSDKLDDPDSDSDIRASIPHEDADPALVAHAQENNVRLRRKLRTAATLDSEDDDHNNDDENKNAPNLNESLESRTKRANARYRRRFCQGTAIEFVPLDLGSMASALECARIIRSRHPYVTHIVLNAGSAAWVGLNWFHAVWMVLTSFRYAVTWPAYKIQRAGDVSDDGFGWVWQCNVGAHWILVRALLPSLRATPYSVSSRVLWTSSVEAFSHYYDSTDYQCLDVDKSPLPYESTKYQCELAAFGLDDALQTRRMRTQPGTPLGDTTLAATAPLSSIKNESSSEPKSSFLELPPASRPLPAELEPRVYLTHPGVVASSIFADFLNVFLAMCMKAAFYFARWVLSPHHPVEAYKGAVSVSHVCLAPVGQLDPKRRYGSRCDFWGREYVGSERIDDWRPSLGGAGPGVGARLALSRVDPDESFVSDGDGMVLSLAREYVTFCEKVARQVWQSARTGDLPPWNSLDSERDEAPAYTLKTKNVPDKDDGSIDKDEWEKVDSVV